MRSLIIYCGQMMLVSALLYGYYCIFLRNRQMHLCNRFFLLLVPVIALIIPLFEIPFFVQTKEETSTGMYSLLQTVYASASDDTIENVNETVVAGAAPFNRANLLLCLYILVVVVLLCDHVLSILRIKRIARLYPNRRVEDIVFINTDVKGTPFSFFRWLFWNDSIDLESFEGKQMLNHELAHIRQKHSWDVMFMEFVRVVCWFNPFFYLVRKEIRVIHEFLADEYAAKDQGGEKYAEVLVTHMLRRHPSVVNPFFQTQIKRRIAMITKTEIKHKYQLRKLLILPFAALLPVVTAFRIHPISSAKGEITIVVDAGHGGFDPGAKSPDSKFDESTISLELSKLMQSIAPEYGIRVVLTRESPDALGATKDEDLLNRVKRTKEVNPAAFLSFHINHSLTKTNDAYQERFSGFESYISGKRNDTEGQIIASALLNKLSEIYATRKPVKQRSDAGIYVLDKNTCPAVMLQCGFINNKKDIEFLSKKENLEKIVRTVLSVLRDNAK